jgi:hypothetical protein
MATQSVDLSKVFQAVTKELKANKAALNEADTYNHDHGSNVVDVFQTVSQAVKEKKTAPASEQLQYASHKLQNKPSGSAKVYAQGLSEAATRFQGKQLTTDNAMQLVAALMGSGQQAQVPAASQDPLGSLFSGMLGGQQQSQPSSGGQDALGGLAGSLLSGMLGGQGQTQSSAASQDPLGGLAGSLLSGLMGGEASESQAPQSQPQGGLDTSDLLQAGMAFMQAQQQGSSPVEAIINALMSGSSVASSPHRKESGAMIINTILQVVGALAKK